ncbi:MAG: regulatory protein LacI [Gemmatimonadetes bacterium]|nr:regulatory protein LacI [Gemmatimonadota bacterium]
MTSERATITDVAREAGVSKASVSAVMNEKPGVSEQTRAHVLAVMSRLNYRPARPAARGGTRARRSLGLVIKEMDNPYYTEVASGAVAAGRQLGYTMVVASSEGDYESERAAVQVFCDHGVDGLIITPVLGPQSDLSHLFELQRRNVPFVLLEEVRGVRASLVDIENVEASAQAVEFLFGQGHVHIVHFAGPEYSMHSRERIDGVYRAFSGSAHSFGPDAIVRAGAHLEDGYRAGLEYFGPLSAAQRPTAVTCYNDLVALGLMRALTELGISVPGDVSVVGFDDLQLLDYLGVSLTSVHVPKFEMGHRATEMLIRHIETHEPIPPVSHYLSGRLVLRGSTRELHAP